MFYGTYSNEHSWRVSVHIPTEKEVHIKLNCHTFDYFGENKHTNVFFPCCLVR